MSDDAMSGDAMSDERAILLVDDDETVQEFGAMALSALGHEVVVAGSGRECLDKVTAHPGGFALVVLDLLMAGMDGRETAAELRKLGCEAPILLCSGYELSPAEVASTDATAFLTKPFRMRQIQHAARTLLDSEGGG